MFLFLLNQSDNSIITKRVFDSPIPSASPHLVYKLVASPANFSGVALRPPPPDALKMGTRGITRSKPHTNPIVTVRFRIIPLFYGSLVEGKTFQLEVQLDRQLPSDHEIEALVQPHSPYVIERAIFLFTHFSRNYLSTET